MSGEFILYQAQIETLKYRLAYTRGQLQAAKGLPARETGEAFLRGYADEYGAASIRAAASAQQEECF